MRSEIGECLSHDSHCSPAAGLMFPDTLVRSHQALSLPCRGWQAPRDTPAGGHPPPMSLVAMVAWLLSGSETLEAAVPVRTIVPTLPHRLWIYKFKSVFTQLGLLNIQVRNKAQWIVANRSQPESMTGLHATAAARPSWPLALNSPWSGGGVCTFQ